MTTSGPVEKKTPCSPAQVTHFIHGVIGSGLAAFLLLAVPATAQTALETYESAARRAADHIAKFDAVGMDFFTNQKWDRFHESHSVDVIVHWPDGHQTKGLAQHVEDLKSFFVYAPDARIHEHPIKIASAEWTSVVEVIEGTFTKAMPDPDGKMISPTGKAFRLVINDIGHWRDGVMDEEYLFWDNLSFMQQIGIAP